MKTLKSIQVVIAAVVVSIFFMSNQKYSETIITKISDSDSTTFTIPANIQTIIDKSCVMCHTTESKNFKGKTKLNFDKMINGSYSINKIASKLRKIDKVVMIKKNMPTKKFLKNYPDKAISDTDRKTLSEWALNENKKIKATQE